jgi:eukaryotic-like serine/threonine-protein kinase
MRCLNCRQDRITPENQLCPGCGMVLSQMMRDILPTGAFLAQGKYQIDYALGQDGFGITYQAIDLELERFVAIKEFYPKALVHRDLDSGDVLVPKSESAAYAHWLERFAQEGQILERLDHPGIVKIYTLFKEHETAYLVMEFLSGFTLQQELDCHPQGRFPNYRVAMITAAMVSALETAHEAGIFHLDLSPNHVMLTDEGRMVLIDFGAARQEYYQQKPGSSALAPKYTPLELIKGEAVGPESDLFELGMMVHELLTGTCPPIVPNRLHQERWIPEQVGAPWQGMLIEALRLQRRHRPKRVSEWWQTYMRSAQQPGAQAIEAAALPAPESGITETPQTDLAAILDAAFQPMGLEKPHLPLDEPPDRQTVEPTDPNLDEQTLDQNLDQTIDQPIDHQTSASSQTQQIIAEQPTLCAPPDLVEPNPPAFRLNRRLLLVSGFGLTGVMGSLLLSRFRHRPAPSPEPKIVVSRPTPVSGTTALAPAPFSSPSQFAFEYATVNETGQTFQKLQKQARYFTETLSSGIQLEMIEIPAGEMLMGSPATELERKSDEGPQHLVRLSGFYMGRFTITQAQWQAIMRNNPAKFQGENRPVENISWNDAQAFCKKLSRQTGRTYRLPSEAEWEYACRAGTTTPFACGSTLIPSLANYDGSLSYGAGPKGEFRQQTTSVGTFPANAFGLHDMHGNVWEWCEDIAQESYNGAPKDGSAWVTRNGADLRVLRGGSWFNAPSSCRSARRVADQPSAQKNKVGFRVVVSLL